MEKIDHDFVEASCKSPVGAGSYFVSFLAVDEYAWSVVTMVTGEMWCNVVSGPHFEAEPGLRPTFIFEARFRPESQIYRVNRDTRSEHGQDHDWIFSKIRLFRIRIRFGYLFIFEKNWIRTGSGYWFDFHNEIFLRVIQDVTNDGGFYIIRMRCTHHNQ